LLLQEAKNIEDIEKQTEASNIFVGKLFLVALIVRCGKSKNCPVDTALVIEYVLIIM
jgi:hypothetical protein